MTDVFDNPVTQRFTQDRINFITPLISDLRKIEAIESALDVGSGMGEFSEFFSRIGIPRVLGIEGRAENVSEAQRRYPNIHFQVGDVEELSNAQSFDLVLCFGLVYHLENPFRAVRRLQKVTSKFLLLESMCVPGNTAYFEALDEMSHINQGLNTVALYPSATAISFMLYRSGFSFVYSFSVPPRGPFYVSSIWQKQMRVIFLASKIELKHLPHLQLIENKSRLVLRDINPWSTLPSRIGSFVSRLRFYAGTTLGKIKARKQNQPHR